MIMANVNSLASNSSNSINLYGNRNVLSGLASGLDTEQLISNSVSGYQTKIEQLRQDQEKIEWKQDAYRSIIDAGTSFTKKYTSYTSKTNLYSQSFYSKDSSTIVDAIQSFVDDYNSMVEDTRIAYKTQPATDSKHNTYKPLTEKDKSTMSEYAIKKYEDKAKQGLLYNDSDLAQFYQKLTAAVSQNSDALKDIGITTAYENGMTTLSLDADKLRESLFGDASETGNTLYNLVSEVRTVVNKYTSTSSGSLGILVKKAGTKSSLLNNDLREEYDRIQTKIDKWESKLSKQIDYYTRQFTMLEQMMNTMNNQSSMLAGLMGG